MSAAELREAAALMRSRAEVARAGRWFSDADEVWADWEFEDRLVARCSGSHADGNALNSAHIASWHPVVALAVADWLEACADFEQKLNGGEGKGPADPRQRWQPHQFEQALSVARAYLGRT